MELDPLLAPLLANHPLDASDDISQSRAGELAFAKSIVGTMVKPVPDSVSFRDEVIGGPDPANPVIVRIYHPQGARTRAGLVFIHGGGWATGSIETTHEHCGNLAADGDVVVISVGYRLAPENPFPAGLDDVYHSLVWTVKNAGSLGIDADRVAVGGGSAGGNLAAAVALRARDEHGPSIALQLLEIPVLDLTLSSPSCAEVAREFPQLGELGRRTLARYVTEEMDVRNPYVSPMFAADFSDLPPALLLACEIDPVRDDCARYAELLRQAGVRADYEVFPGLIHGTQELTLALPAAAAFHRRCAAALLQI